MADIKYAGEYIVEECTLCTVGGLELNLLEQPVQLQDHFIKLNHTFNKKFIEIVRWEKVGYEVRYTFMKELQSATFRTYINGQMEFKNPLILMPNFSPNNDFNATIEGILKHLPNVSIKRIHKMSEKQAVKEMEAAGFKLKRNIS